MYKNNTESTLRTIKKIKLVPIPDSKKCKADADVKDFISTNLTLLFEGQQQKVFSLSLAKFSVLLSYDFVSASKQTRSPLGKVNWRPIKITEIITKARFIVPTGG